MMNIQLAEVNTYDYSQCGVKPENSNWLLAELLKTTERHTHCHFSARFFESCATYVTTLTTVQP